jgi:hypothetical protein
MPAGGGVGQLNGAEPGVGDSLLMVGRSVVTFAL